MQDNQNFTEGSILKKMLKFMLPILGALILQAMYGAVDMLIVGQFGSSEGISAVTTGSGVVNLATFTVCGLTMGVTILLGRYLGEKKEEKLSEVISGAVAFFGVLAIAVSVLLIVFALPLAQIMQAPKEAESLTVQYIVICGAGMIFVVAYNVISSVMRGMGNSNLPLAFVAIACVVNIIGDLVFVALLGWDVAGAALATILAQAVSVILSLFIIKKQKMPFKIKKEYVKFNPEVKNFFFLGLPLAFQEILTNITFLALCAFINALGLAESSGYGVGQRIQSFVLLIPGSIMQSMSSFVAQNVGAGKFDRAKKAMKTGMIIGASVGVIIAYLSFFHGDIMSMVFTNDPSYIKCSADYLKGFALEAIVTSFLFSFMGYFNGHGRSLFVMIQGLAQSILVRLPFAYIMSIQPEANLMYIGFAAPAATVFGIILCFIYYIRMNRTLHVTRR